MGSELGLIIYRSQQGLIIDAGQSLLGTNLNIIRTNGVSAFGLQVPL